MSETEHDPIQHEQEISHCRSNRRN